MKLEPVVELEWTVTEVDDVLGVLHPNMNTACNMPDPGGVVA